MSSCFLALALAAAQADTTLASARRVAVERSMWPVSMSGSVTGIRGFAKIA
jgi:hypothetical protein